MWRMKIRLTQLGRRPRKRGSLSGTRRLLTRGRDSPRRRGQSWQLLRTRIRRSRPTVSRLQGACQAMSMPVRKRERLNPAACERAFRSLPAELALNARVPLCARRPSQWHADDGRPIWSTGGAQPSCAQPGGARVSSEGAGAVQVSAAGPCSSRTASRSRCSTRRAPVERPLLAKRRRALHHLVSHIAWSLGPHEFFWELRA